MQCWDSRCEGIKCSWLICPPLRFCVHLSDHVLVLRSRFPVSPVIELAAGEQLEEFAPTSVAVGNHEPIIDRWLGRLGLGFHAAAGRRWENAGAF